MPAFPARRIVAPRRQPNFRTATLKSPTGGLNARDSIADMDVGDAVKMTNMWPTTADVVVRDGYTEFATGLGAEVEGIFSYNKAAGTREIFASADDSIFDISSGGAVGAAEVTGLTNARWQHTMFATTGGTFLYLVNGADDPLLYDGSTWTAINGASTPAITGVTTNTLINVNVFKTRLWFIQKDTLVVWYLAAGSIAGAATAFDLRSEFKKGGFLRAMGTWSIDGGEGLDDYAVFVTSEGEVAVYKGTDPASATTFAKVGTFQLGNPIGFRCLDKYGGDLILINRDGLFPLSKTLQSDRVNIKSALSDKINNALATLSNLYGATFGWETQIFPQQNMLILNVPVPNGSYQFVMNTITGAWSLFKGWDASCWERSGEEVYFGASGVVNKIWNIPSDDGNNVRAEVLQAFSPFKTWQQKFFKMAKPIIATNGKPSVLIALNVDYDTTAVTGGTTFTDANFGVWDTDLWDEGVWGGDPDIKKDWQTAGAIGVVGALSMQVATKSFEFEWKATQFVMEDARGTVL